MRVRYSSSALRELDAILHYIGDRSPSGAAHVWRRLKEIERIIGAFPKSGTMTADPDVRVMFALPYRYAVFYEEIGGEMFVHRIQHTSRAP